MKLKFKNQQFQTDAASSIVDLFKGQEKLQSNYRNICRLLKRNLIYNQNCKKAKSAKP